MVERAVPGRWRPIIAPLMQIVPLVNSLDVEKGTRLLFTSRNAVDVAAPLLNPGNHGALCVGPATTRHARSLGLDAVQAGTTVDALIDTVLNDPELGKATHLHLRGAHTTRNIASALGDAGISAREQIIYDQRPCPLPQLVLDDLATGRIAAVTLFSARSARLLATAAPDMPGDVVLFCLSDAVAAALPVGARKSVRIAPQPDASGMLSLLRR